MTFNRKTIAAVLMLTIVPAMAPDVASAQNVSGTSGGATQPKRSCT